MKKNNRAAFTLLELLVVIAIIGILISMGVASFSNAQRKARDSRRREDIKAVQNGLEQYYADHDGSYPAGVTMHAVVAINAGSTYFPAGAPVDPRNEHPYEYSIYVNNDQTNYCVCARLETALTGNANNAATSETCTFGANGNWFCLTNLQ